MNTLKKHSLSGAILIASCFILLAGACENSDWIDTEGQTKNVLLGFNASTTNITTGTRSIEAIEGFTGNSYTFGMSITKDNNWGSEIFPSSGDFMATMARPLEAHHERQKEKCASNPDIDTSRSKYNFHMPAIVNEFVDYIMISKKQVINGKTVYPIDIYYNGIGIITTPTAEEYEEMFQERLKQKCAKKQKTA